MTSDTASRISAQWLNGLAVNPPLDRFAAALEAVVPEPVDWACTTDERLAILADRALWITTATTNERGDLGSVTMQRVDLRSERIRATLTQSYSRTGEATMPEWHFHFDAADPLVFRAAAVGDAPIVFGSRVVEAVGS
jgi:hypothetical protein